MTTDLDDEYPEATQYIRNAVAEHGEEWVLVNYYEQLYPLSVVMAMPEKDELPFYDEDDHETMTEEERMEMYQAWGKYRENLRTGRSQTSDSHLRFSQIPSLGNYGSSQWTFKSRLVSPLPRLDGEKPVF